MSTANNKRSRFGAPTSVSKNISDIIDPAREQGAPGELIAMERIIPDRENARKIPLDFNNPESIDDNDPDAESKKEYLEELWGLARTIDSVGLIQPVTAYRRGNDYMLVVGHRRYLAHKLLGRKSIMATITKAPNQIRLQQFVENMQRQDLSLPERMMATSQLLSELEVRSDDRKGIVAALDKGGVKKSTSYMWAHVLGGPQQVRDAIVSGEVTSLKVAAEIAALPENEVAAALENLQHGPDENTGQPENMAEKVSARPRSPGRPSTKVKFGTTQNAEVARLLVTKVLGDDAPDIDWTDLTAATNAFKAMIKKLEEQLK